MSTENETNKIVTFIENGSELGGTAVGGAIGFFAAGPVGAAAGAAVGTLFSMTGKTIADHVDKQLSDSEILKSSAVASFAIDNIKKKIDKGNKVRDDDFFRVRTGCLPSAQELFEGVLIKSKQEYETKKLTFYGSLYANICFDASVSAEEAIWFLSLLEKITFRHLVILHEFSLIEERKTWTDNKLVKLRDNEPILVSQIEELRSYHFLSPVGAWDSEVSVTSLGNKFLSIIDFDIPEHEDVSYVRDKLCSQVE